MNNNLDTNLQQDIEIVIEKMTNRFNTISTGRANPNMLSQVKIDYYGTLTPLSQVASISVPDANQLLVKPFNQNDAKAIVAAISKSKLNMNPQNEGNQIRIKIPALTEEIRVSKVKEIKKINEETKIQFRNLRRDYNNKIKADKDLTKDEIRDDQDSVQKIIDTGVKKITQLAADKEKSLMKI